MNLAYAKAIDLLVDGGVDYKSIAVNLAKLNPELFVQLAQGKGIIESWCSKVIDFIKEAKYVDAKYVDAIKLIRTETGFGLKEAKDVADVLRSHMVKAHMIEEPFPSWASPNPVLSNSQRAVLGKLLTAAGI